jgi:lysophospholipid acyltransferase (LPLAT)-like uncharacterized protein
MSKKGKKISHFLLKTVGVTIISGLLKLILLTMKFTFNDRELFFRLRDKKDGIIYAFFHCDLFLIAMTAKRYRFSKKDTYVLASMSRDGELVVRMASRFGVKSVRGSSSRGGARGLFGLKEKLMEGANGAIAVDGPRGPRFEAKSGAIMLAKSAGVPVYPVVFNLTRKIEVGSWDKTQIPLPFCRCHIIFGEPITPDQAMSNEEIERNRERLENTLVDLKSRGTPSIEK